MDRDRALSIFLPRHADTVVTVDDIDLGEQFSFRLRYPDRAEPEYVTLTREELEKMARGA